MESGLVDFPASEEEAKTETLYPLAALTEAGTVPLEVKLLDEEPQPQRRASSAVDAADTREDARIKEWLLWNGSASYPATEIATVTAVPPA
jgi:hypothetical protein